MTRRLAGAVAVALVLLASSPTVPAVAQSNRAGPDRVRLASQTPWVGPGSELVLRLLATTAVDPADVELAVAVHPIVRSRTVFAQTLTDRVRGAPLSVTTTVLAELTADEGGAVVVRLPVDDLDPLTPSDRSQLQLRREFGVYPVRVELRRAGGGPVLDVLTTHLVYAVAPEESPALQLAWVMPFHAKVTRSGEGDAVLSDEHLANIASTVTALVAHPTVPVTLSPTAETLAVLAASEGDTEGAALAGLVRLARDHQVLPAPFVPVSYNAMAQAGLGAEATAQMNRSGEIIRDTLGVRPDPRTRLLDELPTTGALALLREQQVDRLIVPEAGLSPNLLPVSLAQPFELADAGGTPPLAASTDPGLTAHLERDLEPVLAAHQLLADLAMIQSENPGRSRGVVIATPRGWKASPPFLDAVLTGLESSPTIATTSVDDLFNAVPPAADGRGRPLSRSVEVVTEPTTLPGPTLRATRTRVRAFTAVLAADNPLGPELADAVLAAEAVDLRSSPRRQRIEAIRERIDEQIDGLKMPTGRTVTLTARRGEIPITVLSELGYDVQARLRVESDQLRFPGGPVRLIDLRRRNTTEVVEVRAQSSGAFPLRVQLESPDGGLVLASTRLTVRSTSASWVGIGLSVGAALFLVVWWARHLAQGRRNRRLVPA